MKCSIVAMSRFLISAFVLLTGACANTHSLIVGSEPEGATLTTLGTGVDLGLAPVLLVYEQSDLEKSRQEDGCYRVRGIEARWRSGAMAVIDPITLCDTDQRQHERTLTRPDTSPDLRVDLQFAHELRAADMDAHRRAQGNRTQYSPQQTPTKPNGPAVKSGPPPRSP